MKALPGTAGLERLSLAALALLLTLPFLIPIHRYPIPSFYNEWAAFALGLLCLVIFLRPGAWNPFPLPAMAIVVLGFAGAILLQSAFGKVPYAEQATVALQYLVWAAALMAAGALLRRECGIATVAKVMAWSLLAGAALNGGAALLQHYYDPALLPLWITPKTDAAVYGNLAQRNHLACHITLGLASLAYLYGKGALRAAVAAGIALFLLIVLALAASRSSFVYLAVLTLLAAGMVWVRRDAPARGTLVFMFLTIPGFVLANWIVTLDMMQPAYGSATAAMIRIFDTAGGINERLQVWQEAWRAFVHAPWFGTGFGTFAWQHYAYHANSDVALTRGENFNHAHNIVLHVLAELGIVGAALLAAAAVLLTRDIARAPRECEGFLVIGVIGVLLVYSLLEYPLWYAYFLGPFAFAIGTAGTAGIAIPVPRAGRAGAAILLAGGFSLVLTAGVNYRHFEQLFFVGGADKAQHADPERFMATMASVYSEPLLVPYVELAATYGIHPDRLPLSQQFEIADRTIRFAPYGPAIYRRVLLHALAGNQDAMRSEFATAAKIYPEQVPAFLREVQGLRAAHPAQVEPLLELATANLLERAHARGAGGD